MEQADRELLVGIEAHAIAICRGHDPAHDDSHIRRVVANARRIMDAECNLEPGIDEFVVLAACWLHDIVQLPKGSSPPGESARQSAQHSLEFLPAHGLDTGRAAHVAAAVESHSFSGGKRPATLEAGIVQDADRLDALGAVGLARLWVIAGKLDSKLHHPTDAMAVQRPLDDARYALDHIERKLLKLPELMNTDTGRKMARERAEYLVEYRERFLGEIGGDFPHPPAPSPMA